MYHKCEPDRWCVTHFLFYSDGTTQLLAGCLRDFRNKPFPTRAKIEYYQNTLTVCSMCFHSPAIFLNFITWFACVKYTKLVIKMFVDVCMCSFHMLSYTDLLVSISSYFLLSVCCYFPVSKILSYQRSWKYQICYHKHMAVLFKSGLNSECCLCEI
jgi:hypothetical protein